ncbi:DNA polymerase III [Gracilinema caldarium]|uniref:DNA polymerase III n=1 Tax=Gracilinema caldarium TaxID=215591 RepID=UPI0026E9EAA9|nr:DNA polymerase III [Gracilinema caldarium]
MFENVLGQNAVTQLVLDVSSGTLPPSILFEGPPASGKGTAALELGRALSCLSPGAPWNCTCSECAKHRQLTHPDLLLLGSRSFSAEIAAAAAAYLREPESAAKLLFFRSLRKLLARFNPVLWEGEEARLGKFTPLISVCNETLEELGALELSQSDREKLTSQLIKNAFQLEREGISDTIPIFQIRRAAYWARLAPLGKKKLLVIENADRMQDGARNALLKILEEPPETAQIVLCTTKKAALLPTIRSRLRPYMFEKRNEQAEQDVIRRVFRDGSALSGSEPVSLEGYLESFLPIQPSQISRAAALYFATIVLKAQQKKLVRNPQILDDLQALMQKWQDVEIPQNITVRHSLLALTKDMDNFSASFIFTDFLKELLSICGHLLRSSQSEPDMVNLVNIWKDQIKEADNAVSTYNLNPFSSLERLFVLMLEAI